MTKSPKGSPKRGHAGSARIKIAIGAGLIAAVSAVVFLTGTKPSNASATQKRYKATREIVVDKQTGQRRMPTQEEIAEIVGNLTQLASRPENLPETTGAGDAVIVDLAA